MNLATSLRDTWLVARFEVLRAVRSWQALALVIVYVVANVGGAFLFTRLLLMIETEFAHTALVAAPRWPGTLLDQLRDSERMLDVIEGLVGDPALVAHWIESPFLAIYQLWQGVLLVPFLVATSAADAVSADLRTRAIRFEAMRTGRPELVAGRLVGQVLLAAGALTVALVGVWIVGMTCMVAQDPLALALALANLGFRPLLLALPFIGLGIAVSQLTAAPNWARALALLGTAGSWVAYGVLSWLSEEDGWSALADALLSLHPMSSVHALWAGGAELTTAAVVLPALTVGVAAVGYVRFARRDL